MSHTCRHCGNTIPEAEAADGWCESCGKKVPAVRSERPARRAAVPPSATDSHTAATYHLRRLRWGVVVVFVSAFGVAIPTMSGLDVALRESGVTGTRLVPGIPATAVDSTSFFYHDAKDRKTYFPLADTDPAVFLEGAAVTAAPGVSASVVSLSAARENRGIGIDPLASGPTGIVTLSADVFVIRGTYELRADESARPGPCDIRVTFPAVAERLGKLNSPPAGRPGTVVLDGEAELKLTAHVVSRGRWWAVSLGLGSLLLLGLPVVAACVAAAQWEDADSWLARPLVGLSIAEGLALIPSGYFVFTLFAAGLADLFAVHGWTAAAGVFVATNAASMALARLLGGSGVWSRAWAVAVCPSPVLLVAVAALTLIDALAGFRVPAACAALALVPGIAAAGIAAYRAR